MIVEMAGRPAEAWLALIAEVGIADAQPPSSSPVQLGFAALAVATRAKTTGMPGFEETIAELRGSVG